MNRRTFFSFFARSSFAVPAAIVAAYADEEQVLIFSYPLGQVRSKAGIARLMTAGA